MMAECLGGPCGMAPDILCAVCEEAAAANEVAEALRNLLGHLNPNHLHPEDQEAMDRAIAALAAHDAK